MTTAGLLLDALGVLIIFFATPPVRSQVYLYSSQEQADIAKADHRKNVAHRIGLVLLLTGFALQIAALYV